MSIPNPDLFPDWMSWAKAISRWSEQSTGLTEEDFGKYTLVTKFYQDWTPVNNNKLAYCKNKSSMVHLTGALYSSSSANLGNMFKVPDGVAPKLGIIGQNLYSVIKNTTGVSLTRETMSFVNPARTFGQFFAVTSYAIVYIDIMYQTIE